MKEGHKKIYLAGGCFWGVEAYFSKIDGIVSVISGYANGITDKTEYYSIKKTDHAEAVEIVYDPLIINLEQIFEHYFRIIDPTSLNKRGNDRGRQYRTGIYYTEKEQEKLAMIFMEEEKGNYLKPIVVEVQEVKNFVVAEEYHQNYLEKNPDEYCHIDISSYSLPLKRKKKEKQASMNNGLQNNKFFKPSEKEIKDKLSDIEYRVTQKADTERPFTSKYDDFYEKGIYVDIVTGEPLFSSKDKFNAGCGWPSFSKPIGEVLEYKRDKSHNMERIEVKSKIGDSHLGHVFNDGPTDTAMRYCINGASLKFIPFEDMEKEGYSEYKKYVE